MSATYLSLLRNQLTSRTVNALLRAGYITLEQVDAATDPELLACRNLGDTQLENLRSYTRQRFAQPPAQKQISRPPAAKQEPRPQSTKATWPIGDMPSILNGEVYYQQLYRWYTAGLWEPEIPGTGGSGNHRVVTLNDIEGVLVLSRMYEERATNLPTWTAIRHAIELGGMWIATPHGDFVSWAPPQPALLGLLVDVDHIVNVAHLNVDRWLKAAGRSPLAVAS